MRLIKAFFYSMNGLRTAFKSEAAFRLEIYILIIGVIPCLFFMPLNALEKSFLITTYGLVLIVELLNTSIEKTIDRISLELHPLSKIVKDIASAAVFLSITLCALIWGVILFPKIIAL